MAKSMPEDGTFLKCDLSWAIKLVREAIDGF